MTLALALTDARGPDPTGTAGIRRSFRAAGKMRMNMFRSAMRQAVVEHDVLGLGGAGLSMQPPETRLQAFNGWARVAAGRALGGPWLSEWIARAWASGEATGALQARSQAPGEGSGAWSELAKVELDAIAFAVVQVITREAAVALTKRRANKVMVWRRMAKVFDKVGPPRIMALANTYCVACHNRGRLAAYRAAGITKVGVIPERLLPKQALLLPGGLGDSWSPDQPRGPDGKWSPEGGGGGGSGAPAQSLAELEKLATKFGSAKIVINGEELEISRQVKSKFRRYDYRHGGRNLARDQVEKLFLTGDRLTHDETHKGYRERAAARPEYELSEIEEPIKIGVRTAGDEFVCQACDEFAAGSPYDIDEVEDTLPMHVSCRCTWFPWEDQRYSRDMVPNKSEREKMLERFMRRRHRALARMAPRKFRKPWKDEFDPGQPRDPDGKWTGAGGGSAGGDGHPGKGYSASARTIKGVIHTDNVHDAQRALFENRKVELSQLKQVSTLVDLLGETAAKMEAAGEKAPVFNLCNVSITGTNLFCAESKGIPRVEMPVIRAKKTKEFVKYLKSRGYKTEKSTERADHLRSTQDQIDGAKVAANMKRIDKEGFYKRIVVSRDDYILDGHHTWAGQLGVDARDGSLKGDKTVRITRVDISITKLLAEAETWTGGAGKKAAGQDSSDGYNPNQPRVPAGSPEGGQFGEGGGSSRGESERASAPVYRVVPIEEKPAAAPAPAKEPWQRALAGIRSGEIQVGQAGAASRESVLAAMRSGQMQRAETQKELFPGAFPPIPGKGEKPKPEDFDKAKIDLAPALRNPNTERGKKFAEVWENAVKLDPEEFKKEFLGKVNATMQIEHRYSEDSRGRVNTNELRISGNLQNAEGRNIGTYTREIDLVENSAESAYFVVNPGVQHGGIGKEMLKSNVELYQKMGLDKVKVHANIDVGGYAWAKYGYVPTEDSWDTLRGTLREKLDEGSGSSGELPEEWDAMSGDNQDAVEQHWREGARDAITESEEENWRESGQALEAAKIDTAGKFAGANGDVQWANNAIDKWRSERPADAPPMLSNKRITDIVTVQYDPSRGDGKEDPTITIENVEWLTEHELNTLEVALIDSFNARAEDKANEMDVPDYVVEDTLDTLWGDMRNRDKFSYAEENGLIEKVDDDGGGDYEGPPVHVSEEEKQELYDLLDEDDPKTIWALADVPGGKELLLGSDWSGAIDLHDKDTMARFSAYVGKGKAGAAG